MVGFASEAALVSAHDSGQMLHAEFQKTLPGGVGGTLLWTTLWKVAGMPAAGADPATTPGTAYTNAAGSITFPDKSGFNKYLSSIVAGLSGVTNLYETGYTVILYDRLVGVSGISLTTVGSKTISSTTLPRYTDGLGVQVWLEVTTAINGACTLTMDSYTNDGNTTSTSAPPFSTGVAAVGTLLPVVFAPGDRGARAVATLNVGTAASTTGIVNVLLMKPIAIMAVRTKLNPRQSFIYDVAAFPRIYDGASLGIMFMKGGTTGLGAPQLGDKLAGSISVVYG